MDETYLPIEGDPLTTLVLSVFRLNGALLVAGDRLVEELGLTSARWQVIGVIAASPVPLPIASIARNMGLTRQAVRSVVNDLEGAGLVRFAPNPHHRRAHLVVLTRQGEEANSAAMARQIPWAEQLGRGLPVERLTDAAALLNAILVRLNESTRQPLESKA